MNWLLLFSVKGMTIICILFIPQITFQIQSCENWCKLYLSCLISVLYQWLETDLETILDKWNRELHQISFSSFNQLHCPHPRCVCISFEHISIALQSLHSCVRMSTHLQFNQMRFDLKASSILRYALPHCTPHHNCERAVTDRTLFRFGVCLFTRISADVFTRWRARLYIYLCLKLAETCCSSALVRSSSVRNKRTIESVITPPYHAPGKLVISMDLCGACERFDLNRLIYAWHASLMLCQLYLWLDMGDVCGS